MVGFGQAIVLGLLVVGLVALAKSLIYGSGRDRVIALVCLVIGLGATWLVGASDFASTQIILERPLDTMNFASQALVGILVGGLASGTWQVGVKALSNIGQNQSNVTIEGPASPLAPRAK